MNALRQFDYEALGPDGARRRGAVDAVDVKGARDRLLAEGVTPLRLTERAATAAPVGGSSTLSEREAADFASDLARLLNAGVPLLEALRTSGRIARSRRCQGLASRLARHIEGGGQLSAGLRDAGSGATAMLAALAQVGERSGALGEVLRDAAETLREQAQLRTRLFSLLLYPAAVALLTLTILVVFLVVVAPALKPIFAGLEDQLPLAARILFVVSDATRAFGPWALGAAALAIVTLQATPSGRAFVRDAVESAALSPLALKAPQTAAFATYARALALGLRRGIRLKEAHALAAQTVWARRLRLRLLAHASMLEEAQLSTILGKTAGAPPALLQLAAAGEAAGKLGPAMAEAAAMLADDARTRAERLVALAGPAITLTLGAAVGLVVLTLFRALAAIAEVAT